MQTVMGLPTGTRLGPYEVLAPIGAGGMGEVYRARDTRLDRTVAIKVLPEHIAKREDLRARFEREARAVASLNHPNICVLHDIGSQDGMGFMVMEFMEGETLAARIGRGVLPIDQALKLATQIASALDRAHRAGVTHRDVKPSNIMLTRDGVKMLDFGLAKSTPQPGPAEETLTAALTTEGTVMGTPQYMAPEQLEGRGSDARSDIFAFGAVLYEMLTGKRAFEGKTMATVVAAILYVDPPPVRSLQPEVPHALERLVKVCLEKNPDDRWQTARDLLRELQWISEPVSLQPPVLPKTRRNSGWYVALLGFALAAVLGFIDLREAPPARPVVRSTLTLPSITRLTSFALSPDGRYLAIAAARDERNQLLLRSLDSPYERPLSGTIGASYPFWSPNSRSIGFFAEGKLKKIDVDGEPAQTLCDAPEGRGGTWNGEGTIVFAPTSLSGLSRVSAAGGIPAVVTKLDGLPQRFPHFLPDGRRFLYQVSGFPAAASKIGIYLGSLDSPEVRRVAADDSTPRYVGPTASTSVGYLLFVRESVVIAQPVDPKTLRTKGDPLALGEATKGYPNGGYGQFSASQNGILISHLQPSEIHPIQLAWFDRQGKQLATVGSPGAISCVALSPDGKRLLTSRTSPANDLWISDLEHGTDTRFTFGASPRCVPVWSPDGTHVIFSAIGKGLDGWDVYQKASNGAGEEELLHHSRGTPTTGMLIVLSDWSRDGRFVIVKSTDLASHMNLWVLPLSGDRRLIPLLQSRWFNPSQGQISPDGRWLAYLSDESGRDELYVMPFSPDIGSRPDQPVTDKRQISTSGSGDVRWGIDGKEIFYLSLDRQLMVSQVRASNRKFEWSVPGPVFERRINITNLSGAYEFQPSADGRRFLIATEPQRGDLPMPRAPVSLSVVVNWQGLRK
jgi:eukaryotic-like serine/threonine-protein kinase